GIPLPAGLKESDRLPQPIFTPATKAESGHDENISFGEVVKLIGEKRAEEVKEKTLEGERGAQAYALPRGIFLPDPKLEGGGGGGLGGRGPHPGLVSLLAEQRLRARKSTALV